MAIDLPPQSPIAIHARVPVQHVKTATPLSMGQRSTSQRAAQPLGDLGSSFGFDHYTSPIFLGGKNNHNKKKHNMKHVSKKAKQRKKNK